MSLLATALAAGGFGIGPATISAPVALVVAGLGFAVGVPHGAADHVIATRLASGRPIALVATMYGCLAGCAWALLRWADPTALIVAVALSALHFGLGELEVIHRLSRWWPRPAMAAAIVVAACGALLLPLARCGAQLSAVATAVSPNLATAIVQTPVQQGMVAVWLLAAFVVIVGSLRSGHPAVALDVVIVGAVVHARAAFRRVRGVVRRLARPATLRTSADCRARLRRVTERWPAGSGGAAADPTCRSALGHHPGRCWPPSAGLPWRRQTRRRWWPTC